MRLRQGEARRTRDVSDSDLVAEASGSLASTNHLQASWVFLTPCLFFCSQKKQKWSPRKFSPSSVARVTVVWLGPGFNLGPFPTDALAPLSPGMTGEGYKFWKTRNLSACCAEDFLGIRDRPKTPVEECEFPGLCASRTTGQQNWAVGHRARCPSPSPTPTSASQDTYQLGSLERPLGLASVKVLGCLLFSLTSVTALSHLSVCLSSRLSVLSS